MRKIGLLTGGGDCPGINTVIRAVAKTAFQANAEVIGFLDGYSGLVEERYLILDAKAISGLLHRGGTILGTNNRDDPFRYPTEKNGKIIYRDMSSKVLATLETLGIKSLIVIGGDGSMAIARELTARGGRIIGVPKTIDNDLPATDQTFGFDTAVNTATEALDKLHTTAESHHRVMVLELMGRYAGWIALASGIAGGADVILIPEIPWQIENVVRKILTRKTEGKPFSIVVVAEGTKSPHGELVVKQKVERSAEPLRLGGIGQVVGDLIEASTGIETRVTVLGHIQRGGPPTPFDRILATRLGVKAAQLALAETTGVMVCLQNGEIKSIAFGEIPPGIRTIPPESQMIEAARAIGISFGDR